MKTKLALLSMGTLAVLTTVILNWSTAAKPADDKPEAKDQAPKDGRQQNCPCHDLPTQRLWSRARSKSQPGWATLSWSSIRCRNTP